MREGMKRCLSVLIAVAVVSAAGFGAVSYSDTQISPIGESDALLPAIAAYGAAAVIGAGASYAYTKLTDDASVNESKLNDLDARETKLELHKRAGTQRQNNDNLAASMNNYLNDTQPISTMEGKNAAIRAFENGSSKATAKSEARQAIDDYYSVKQVNLVQQWNTAMVNVRDMRKVANNTQNVSKSYVQLNYTSSSDDQNPSLDSWDPDAGTKTLTLANGTTIEAKAFHVEITYNDGCCSGSSDGSYGGDHTFRDQHVYFSDYNSHFDPTAMTVMKPYPDYSGSPSEAMRMKPNPGGPWNLSWRKIEQQRATAQTRVDTFINQTYDDYMAGTLNTSDLTDPYLNARYYSPKEETGTWALSTFASMGYEPPKNLSNVGTMTVTDHKLGNTYEGILLSDGLPAGDTFEANTTYNASNIAGPQMVVTNDGAKYDLSGEFTIDRIESPDGEVKQNIEYVNRTGAYSTTSVSGYEDLMNQLQELQAQVEARQQAVRDTDGGGGGLFSDGFSLGLGLTGPQKGGLVVVFVAFLAVLLVRP